MHDRCPDCRGFVDTGSCVCKLSAQIRAVLMEKFDLTYDEYDAAWAEGRFHITQHEMGESLDTDVVVETAWTYAEGEGA